jgi:uncharacterized protein YndB with AHSA1/START domain
MKAALALIAAMALAGPVSAEVVTRAPDGFVSSASMLVPRAPAAVWAALVQWGSWWSPAHSYSGKASNYSLVPRATGTLVETWDDQSVRHAVVLMAMPPKMLRLQGGFGPLQALPVSAILDYVLVPEAGGTRLTFTYRVAGPQFAHLPDLADPVDGVMSEAFARLGRFATTGKPE